MAAPAPNDVTRGRVLFMDDEEAILDVVGRMLGRRGFTVTPARDGEEAVRAYREAVLGGSRFDVVVLDLSVPGGQGALETIELLGRIDPGVRALVSSGHANDPAMVDPAAFGFAGVVPKPYSIDELVAALVQAMA